MRTTLWIVVAQHEEEDQLQWGYVGRNDHLYERTSCGS